MQRIYIFVYLSLSVMPETIHAKHRALLHHLRENSREKLTTISKKTKIPISTLFDLLKELQGTFITKSTILLDYHRLGYGARAHVFIKVSNDTREQLQKHLQCHTNVNSIHKINNRWSFVIETIHKNIRDLDKFLENIEKSFNIENKEIHYIIDEVKREGFVMEPIEMV